MMKDGFNFVVDDSVVVGVFDLKNWPTLLALLSASVLCLSAIYNYIYFSIIGKEFLELLSTSDHVRQSFHWIPTFITFNLTVMIAAGYLSDLDFDKRIASKKQIDNGEKHIIKTTAAEMETILFARLNVVLVILISLTVLLILLLFLAESLYALAVHSALMIVAIGFLLVVKIQIRRVQSGTVTLRKRDFELTSFVFAVLFLTAYVAGRGVSDALADLNNKHFPIELCDAKRYCRSVNILKTIDAGVIYLERGSNTIRFDKWTDLSSISKKVDDGVRIPLACRWIPSICGSRTEPVKASQANPQNESVPP